MTAPTQQTRIAKKLKKLSAKQRMSLLDLATPRVVEPYIAHIPHPKQQVFLSLTCREAMYGGAAGGGKSDAVLMAALQYVDVPGYSALILRRTWPDLNAPGAILDRARTWLGPTDAQQKEGGRTFIFPSGAKLTFGYMQHEKDKYKFQSAEYQYIGFDELTHFEEAPYLYLFSRLRRPDLVCLNCIAAVRKYPNEGSTKGQYKHTSSASTCKDVFPDPKVIEQYPESDDGISVFDVPLRMRSATNPGGIGNEWVKERFVSPLTRAKGAVFIPAKLKDNPSLDRDSYRESLSHLAIVDRQRLEDGDWEVTETGDFFERAWFKPITGRRPNADRRPRIVRFWDLAGTEGGGDYTAGCLLVLHSDGRWEIQDIIRKQYGAMKIEQLVKHTALADGQFVPIRMEQEPGSAGKNIIDHYRRNILTGYNFDGARPTGSKEARAYNAKVAAEKGLVDIVVNEYTRDFLNEAEAFPGGANDDMIDAFAGAFTFLSFERQGRLLV